MFGKYFPGNSFVNKLNPALKIIASIFLIIWILLANNWPTYLFLTAFILLVIYESHSSVKLIIDGVKPILWLIAFSVLIQILFGVGGHIYFKWGIISITSSGLMLALMIFARLVLIVIVATILTNTTSPTMIAAGVQIILKPFSYLKVPTETIGMMVSIALRFIPTLVEELSTIMDAQRARGVDFGRGGLIKRVKNLISLVIPLFVSAFRHAENLADAMESRGYNDKKPRSHYQKIGWNWSDWLSLTILIGVGILVVWMRN